MSDLKKVQYLSAIFPEVFISKLLTWKFFVYVTCFVAFNLTFLIFIYNLNRVRLELSRQNNSFVCLHSTILDSAKDYFFRHFLVIVVKLFVYFSLSFYLTHLNQYVSFHKCFQKTCKDFQLSLLPFTLYCFTCHRGLLYNCKPKRV